MQCDTVIHLLIPSFIHGTNSFGLPPMSLVLSSRMGGTLPLGRTHPMCVPCTMYECMVSLLTLTAQDLSCPEASG